MIKPGYFGKTVCADNRRMDFDFGNEQLLYLGTKIDLLFIGDSITQLWDIPAYIGREKCIVNRAIGGDDSTYLLRRFDADCIQLAPARCVLMIGTNDISRTHYDHWWRTEGEPQQLVLEEYKANLRELVRKCKAAGVALSFCSVIPSDIAPPFDKELRFSMTAEMNGFLRGLCAENCLQYIDYFPALCLPDGKTIRPDYTPDGIHPNARGYAAMARILTESLRNAGCL